MSTPGVPSGVAIAGVGIIAAAALALAAENAGSSPARTSVTITTDRSTASGTVQSPKPACRDARAVLLLRQVGAKGGDNDVVVATAVTQQRHGVDVWSAEGVDPEVRFYARVLATPTCRAAMSPVTHS